MKFEEIGNVVSIPKLENVFVYFLLKNNYVVYVGQTKNGILRPLSHRDKDYDEIKIIYCKDNELDTLEDKYIKKYLPKYNKSKNNNVNYSLNKSRNEIRKIFNTKLFCLPDLKKIINKLNIEIYFTNTTPYISINDFDKIIEYIKKEQLYEQ